MKGNATGAFINMMEDKKLRDLYVNGIQGLYYNMNLLCSVNADPDVIEIVHDCIKELELQMFDYARVVSLGNTDIEDQAELFLAELKRQAGINGDPI